MQSLKDGSQWLYHFNVHSSLLCQCCYSELSFKYLPPLKLTLYFNCHCNKGCKWVGYEATALTHRLTLLLGELVCYRRIRLRTFPLSSSHLLWCYDKQENLNNAGYSIFVYYTWPSLKYFYSNPKGTPAGFVTNNSLRHSFGTGFQRLGHRRLQLLFKVSLSLHLSLSLFLSLPRSKQWPLVYNCMKNLELESFINCSWVHEPWELSYNK